LSQQIKAVIERAKDYDDGLPELQRSLAQAIGVRRVDQGRHDEEEEVEESAEEYEPVLHHANAPKKRKTPVKWTAEEEKFLANLIKKDGARWSHFEKNYGQKELFGRSQTAMKDKARNMMRDIINSGREKQFLQLFPKFAEVTVGQARRGVHAYVGNHVPVRNMKGSLEAELDNADGFE
jgi:hypothetical protein